MKRILPISLILLILADCAPKKFENMQQAASTTTGAVGCESFESKTWDALDRYLQEQNEIPAVDDLKEHLKLSMRNLKTSQGPLSEEKQRSLTQDIGELYEILLSEIPQKEQVKDAQSLLGVLAAMEVGDRTSPEKVEFQNRIAAQFEKIKNDTQELDVQCQTPPANTTEGTAPTPAPQVPDVAKSSLPLAVYGSRWTIATAYQSCQALTEPILTKDTPNAEGIGIVGKHSDGVGNQRVISNLTSLLHTHPYYKNVNSYGAGCLKPTSYPLIYDYGGKPYVTTDSSAGLNLFKDAGDGTKVLGIDCSGFIYTALAAAGLRLSPGKNIKAIGVLGVNSAMYIEPQNNGMSCLQKITLSPKDNLRAGDIVAVQGHVLMIDSVGSDPFGLNTVKSASQCASLTAKDFDFVVAQSSPSKNGIGINRYEAKDYLYESDKMKAILEKYAYYACEAKFNNKNYTPSFGTASVIRHTMTADCLGTRIKLAQESCIQSCSQLAK